MSKRRRTAPYIVEIREPGGAWVIATFELSERLANRRAAEYEEGENGPARPARYRDNPDYMPLPPDPKLTVEELLAILEQRTEAGRYIMIRVYENRATEEERQAYLDFNSKHYQS